MVVMIISQTRRRALQADRTWNSGKQSMGRQWEMDTFKAQIAVIAFGRVRRCGGVDWRTLGKGIGVVWFASPIGTYAKISTGAGSWREEQELCKPRNLPGIGLQLVRIQLMGCDLSPLLRCHPLGNVSLVCVRFQSHYLPEYDFSVWSWTENPQHDRSV